jgi:hypothetical protein
MQAQTEFGGISPKIGNRDDVGNASDAGHTPATGTNFPKVVPVSIDFGRPERLRPTSPGGNRLFSCCLAAWDI